MSVTLFPNLPVRAWHVHRAEDTPGGWMARYLGLDEPYGPSRTEHGPLDLVLDALQSETRRGLPVMVAPEARPEVLRRLALRAIPLRHARRQARSDREKYAAALASQKIRDDRRCVPCDDFPPGGHAA